MNLWLREQRDVAGQFVKFLFPISQDLWILNLGVNLLSQQTLKFLFCCGEYVRGLFLAFLFLN